MKYRFQPVAIAICLFLGTESAGAQTWIETAEVRALNPRPNGKFGRALAISGDTLVVGEMYGELYECPPSSLEASYVHVLERDLGGAGNWGHSRVLVNPPFTCSFGAAGFGMAVDVDGDTLVVGAAGEGPLQEGAAYVFERHLGGPENWGQAAVLLASDYLQWGSFGCSVAVGGDTIAVGALSSSAAYVFERNQGGPGAWGEVRKLEPMGTVLFGVAVDVSGDTIAVGSPHAWMAAGEAHVFERNQGGAGAWGEVRRLQASDGFAGDLFGQAIALDGDALVAGAEGASGGSPSSGAAYVFERDLGGPGNWGEAVKLAAQDVKNTQFGYSVSIDGSTAAVGSWAAPYPDGAAYVYSRDLGGAGAWGQAHKLTKSSKGGGFDFSAALGVSGGTIATGSEYASLGEWVAIEALAFDAVAGRLFGAYGYEVSGSVKSAMTLDPATGAGAELGPIGFEKVRGMAFDPGTNTLFASATKGPDQLLTIDLSTGAGTAVGPIGFQSVQALAFDPLTNVLYGADRQSDQLLTIDTATGVGTAVGAFGGGFDEVLGLAFDPASGVLYASDVSSYELLTVDIATGAATAVGALGFIRVESLAFDAASGVLYGVDRLGSQLLTIDTTTGAGTAIQTLHLPAPGAAYVFGFEPPASYCTAGTSAGGCAASLSGAGIPSASQPAGFTLLAAGVEGGWDGLFYFGTGGRQANPWGYGTSYQCVAPPVWRGGLMSGAGTSGQCDGTFGLDLNARWAARPAQNPGPGARVQAQLWYRDPASTGNQTTGLSDALELLVAP